MDKNIKESMDSLIQTIEESEIQKSYEKAKLSWLNAKESRKLLNEFLEARNTLDIFEQGKFPGIEEQKEKLKGLYDKVNSDPNIKDWFEMQDKFQQFVWEAADYLSGGLNFKFAPKQKSCCG